MKMGLRMKNLGVILLAGASGLLLAGTAAAADLPTKKAAPAVEYVKVCGAYGAGFFTIPGSDTCLKIGGVVRFEENFRSNAPSAANQAGLNLAGTLYPRDTTFSRARVFLNVDARSQTDEGELRSFFSFRDTQDTLPGGPFGGGKLAATTPTSPRASAGYNQGNSSNSFRLSQGYVQWAGIQAGVAHSFFDFYTHDYELQDLTMGVSDQPLVMFGYTAKFGGGFSASASAEDPRARQIGDSTADIGIGNNAPKSSTQAAYLTYGAVKSPDVVGNLHYEGGWGSAQVSGALHQVDSAPIFGCIGATSSNCGAGNIYSATVPLGFQPSSVWGYAVNGGVKLKLDALGAGDSFTVQGSYATGATDYVNSLNYATGMSSVYSSNQVVGVPANDAFVLPNGSIGLSKEWGVFAGIQHYWVPTVRSSLFGSYMQVSNPTAAQVLSAGADNARAWNVGFNAIWSPIKALDIGAELVYENLNLNGANTLKGTNPLGVSVTPYIPANSNDLRARLRIQATF